jgi:hypothetical protein
MEFKPQRIGIYRINIAMQNNAKSLFDDFASCKLPFVGVRGTFINIWVYTC